MASKEKVIRETFERGGGVLRLMPCFIPRPWGKAGRRLRLHPTITTPPAPSAAK